MFEWLSAIGFLSQIKPGAGETMGERLIALLQSEESNMLIRTIAADQPIELSER